MGTRSIIMVVENDYNDGVLRLYRHQDGYPSSVLEDLNNAIERAVRLESENEIRWKDKKSIPASSMANLILAECATIHGGGAYIEERFEYERFEPKHLGDQEDLEWIYIVNTTTKTIEIYGGGYTGKAPQYAFKKGIVNPLVEVNGIREECKEDTRQEIIKHANSIKAWSWKVNPIVQLPKKATTAKRKRA